MKNAVFLILALVGLSCARPAALPEEDSSHAVSNHLSGGQVNAFAEDGHGQVWMATSRGLDRYDGKSFHQFFHSSDTLSLPDNNVTDLLVDAAGTLWVATLGGVARMDDKGDFHRIYPDGEDNNTFRISATPSGDIFAVFQNHVSVCRNGSSAFGHVLDIPESYGQARLYPGTRNSLWVVTVNRIYCLDIQSLEVETSYETPHPVLRSELTRDGQLCLAGSRQFSLFNTRSRRFQSFERKDYGWPGLAGRDINVIHEPEEGKLLFATSEGPFLYDRAKDRIISRDDADFPYAIPDFRIKSFFTDSNGLLWIGSDDQGYAVSAYGPNPYGDKKNVREFFSHKSVASVSGTPDGDLWVSTKRYGLFFCQMDKDSVIPVSLDPYLEENPLGIDYCNRVMVARDGSLWLCLLGNGKVLHARYKDGDRLELIRMYKGIQVPDRLLETSDGAVWVGNVIGMVYRCTEDGVQEFTPFATGQIKLVDGLLEWDDGRVLLSSSSGGIVLADKTGKIEKLSDQSVFPPFRDNAGRIWAYTADHCWVRITQEGLENTACPPLKGTFASACVDEDGYLWIGTTDGLVRMDSVGEKSVSFSEEDGISGNEFADDCVTVMSDGHVVFGGPMGLTLFTPLSNVNQRRVPLCFQELRVHNRLVNPGPGAPAERLLSENPPIRLSHLQNSFGISYAAMDYVNVNRISYRYMLEGFDPHWIEAGREHEADYSNIPAGRYTFRVQAMDSVGSLTDCEASLSIRVKPDPWRSWWAVSLYILLGLSLLFLGVYQGWLRKQKDQEAGELTRLNAMQMNFFANVAHEFRTPLTMIAGPVSALSASERISGQDRKMLSIMQRSVNWMLHLVNQILDFNRLEGDRLELKVSKQDIVPCVNEVIELFQAHASSKGIAVCNFVDGSFQMWLDADKLTKILMNLLSNALKFTPVGGQVEVAMDVLSRERAQLLFPLQEKDTDNRFVYLSVKDTGPGIPEEQLEPIFERFHQLKRGQVALGSGIGLYYSRSLATIHHGYLKAWNRTDGPSGAVFGLLLPASTYSDSEKAEDASQQKIFPIMHMEGDAGASSESERQKILVVDDDIDIANYLKVMLQPRYQVETCFDVDSAMKTMAQEAPDLVLSDVMMPGKSGYELCEAIKSDIQLCHIPVILVTAMAQVSSQVEGLEKGADAYVTKPFDPAYLTALAGSILDNREKLRRQLGKVSSPSEVEDTRMSPQDKAFMKELYRLMDAGLSNPELDVSLLSEKLRISRSKFYYKVKGLTGENPGEFFRRYKLNKAAGLLLKGKYNISEVADQTGFSSLSYFSSCFKKQFGVPPSEYKG